jgi:hypothetical protein
MRTIRYDVYSLITIFMIFHAAPAFAYIDPNTGGYVFQFLFPLISIFVAGYVFCKKQIIRVIEKVVMLFKRNK